MLIFTRRLLVICMVLSLGACSSAPKREFTEIPDFQTVAVVATEELAAIQHLKSAGEKSLEGASKASTSGMAGGMAGGALLCGISGPFAGLCITGLGMLGWMAGGAGGLLIGIGGVSGDDADRVRETLSLIDQRREFNAELLSELHQRLPSELTAAPDTADVIVSPVLVVLDVDQKKKDKIFLQARAELLFTWTNEAGEQYLGKRDFTVESDTRKIDDWLRAEGALFDEAITRQIEDIADQMAARVRDRVAP